jgi:hypothetical protein
LKQEIEMSKIETRIRGGFIGRAMAVFGAAASAAAAVEGHRKPAKQDLRTLGINGAGFDDIKIG